MLNKNYFSLSINCKGTNGSRNIIADGSCIEECCIKLLDELDYFREEYENNNMKNGGYTAFSDEQKELYNNLQEYVEELNQYV